MIEYRIHLADALPPSLNQVGSRGGWRAWQTHKKLWERFIENGLRDHEVLPARFACVTAVLTVPDKRRRDAGNFGALLEKSCGDALVHAGVLADDTPEFWRWTSVEFVHRPRERGVVLVVSIDPIAGSEAA